MKKENQPLPQNEQQNVVYKEKLQRLRTVQRGILAARCTTPTLDLDLKTELKDFSINTLNSHQINDILESTMNLLICVADSSVYNSRLCGSTIAICEQLYLNHERIVRLLEEGNTPKITKWFFCVMATLESSLYSSENNSRYRIILLKDREAIIESFLNTQNSTALGLITNYILNNSSDEELQFVFDDQIHPEELDPRLDSRRMGKLFGNYFDAIGDDPGEGVFKLLANYLLKYYPPQELRRIIERWDEVEGDMEHAEYAATQNLLMLEELSLIDPSIPLTLWKTRGLTQLGRYSIEALLSQLETPDPNKKPFISTSAAYDLSASLHLREGVKNPQELNTDEFQVYIYEIVSLFEFRVYLEQLLTQLNINAFPECTICVYHAHSHICTMTFGSRWYTGTLEQATLNSHHSNWFEEKFPPGTYHVLAGCLAGMLSGKSISNLDKYSPGIATASAQRFPGRIFIATDDFITDVSVQIDTHSHPAVQFYYEGNQVPTIYFNKTDVIRTLPVTQTTVQ